MDILLEEKIVLTLDKVKNYGNNIKNFINSNDSPDKLINTLPYRYYTVAKSYDKYYPGENLEQKFLNKLKEILKEITSKSEYLKDIDPKAYGVIRHHDATYPDDPWREELFSHVVPLGNTFKRMIYVFEFPDNTAYIGLTYNEKQRQKSHQKSQSPVFKYKESTGLEPKFYRLTRDNNGKIIKTQNLEYIEASDAQKLENDAIQSYKNNGWTTHNAAPAGALGGVTGGREKSIYDIKSFLKDKSNTIESLNLIPGSDNIVKIIKDLGVETEIYNKLEKIIKKNNIKSGKELRKIGGRRATELISKWNSTYPEDQWNTKLFGTSDTKVLPKQSIETFLSDPNNLDKEQLNMVTKNTWKEIKPNQEQKFLNKIKKIIDKHQIKYQSRNPEEKIPSGLYISILSHDKENPNNKWKDELFF